LVFLSSSTCKLCIDVTTTQMVRCIICHPNLVQMKVLNHLLSPSSNTRNRRGLLKYNLAHGRTAMNFFVEWTLWESQNNPGFDAGAIECRHKPRNISLSLLHPLLISLGRH
jgi:hypothetical protein